MIRLDKLLSSRGYCSRSQVRDLIRLGRILVGNQQAASADQKVEADAVTLDGEKLDPGPGMVLMLNKPCGYTCSHKDNGPIVFDLLPERFSQRNPQLVSIGRLDKETSGLLLITDDGKLVHALTSPKKGIEKFYNVKLRMPLRNEDRDLFISGTMLLEEESKPLLPVRVENINDTEIIMILHEGRYHQIRRMLAAVGNEVICLHRFRVGELSLDDLPQGEYRLLASSEIAALM